MTHNKYVWITPATEVRWLWGKLASELYRRHKVIPLFIVGTEQDLKFYLSKVDEGVPAEGVVVPDRYMMAMESDALPPMDEALPALMKFEAETGCGFVREILMPDRQFARAFVFGGDMVASSKTTKRATHNIVWRVGGSMILFFQKLVDKFPPSLYCCLSGGTGMIGRPISALMTMHGVPVRNLVHTRFGFRYFWSEDELHNSDWMNERHREQPMPTAEEVEQVQEALRPTGDFEFYVNRMRKRRRLDRLAVQVLQNIYKHLRYRLGRSRKVKIGYTMSGEIAMIMNGRRQARYLTGPTCTRLKDLLDGFRYVFFPLQVEPEVSLHGLAQEYFDQINTVAQISMNLPADAILIVKEHPAQIGRRSTGFYKRIQGIPNVRLISELEHSYPVMRRCDLIIAVTSSAAHEAAVMGLKVVYLSQNGPLLTIPHVRNVSSKEGLQGLRALLAESGWGTEEDRRRDGVRYYQALEKNAVDFSYIGTELFNRDRVPTKEEISYVADTLTRTLSGETWQVAAQ